jgi:hypothetical protein
MIIAALIISAIAMLITAATLGFISGVFFERRRTTAMIRRAVAAYTAKAPAGEDRG